MKRVLPLMAIAAVVALLLYPRSGSPATGEASTYPVRSGSGSSAASPVPEASEPSPGTIPTPHPSGDIGEPASYFKPTPEPRVVVSKGSGTSGQATWWFSFGHGLYAALRPDLGTKGDLAIVCGGTPYHCLSLPVITTCACLGPGSDRLIDLSRDAFESFADPSVGTVRIVLQVVKGGAP